MLRAQSFNHSIIVPTIMILVTLWRLKSGLQLEVVACEAFRYVEHRPNASELHDGLIQFLLNCAGQRE